MNVPGDRNPCLTVVSVEKKRASRFIKKGDVTSFKADAKSSHGSHTISAEPE